MQELQFLSDGGEMGDLMRNKDWSASFVGAPDTWPQSLRTTLSIILHSKSPMFLFWGPHLVCFYNDAYRPSLGNEGKHPAMLGSPAADYWKEIWTFLKPLINQVLISGEASWSEDQLIPIYRNGKMEDVYWTFSHSPVYDESGIAAGIFVSCNETTEKIINVRKLEDSLNQLGESEKKLNIVIDASELGIWELNLKTSSVNYSDRYLEIFGYKSNVVLTHEELIKRIHPDDLVIREKAFKTALENGTLHYESRLVWEDGSIHWIEGKGKVFYDLEGRPFKIIGTVRDITDRQLKEDNMALMAAIVQTSSDAIISKDLNGIIASWNAAAEQIFGYTEAEMIGQPLTRLIPSDRADEESAILLRLRNGEKVDHFETKRITKDNRLLDISLTISPITGIHGNVIGASKIARNITPQKEAERLIASNEQKFRMLADSMPQFVWTTDAEGNFKYINQALLMYAGLTEKPITEGWLQIVHPDDRKENLTAWLHALKHGTDFIIENRFRRYDGEYRWQLSRAVAQRDELGNIQMWVGTSTDIQDMKEQDQQKDYFISMASHELKTPITSVKGYLQLLQNVYRKSEDVFLQDSLKVMERQTSTLIKLISELLDVSKIKTGGLALNKEHFNLEKLIKEITSEIKHINPDYQIPIISKDNVMVFADRHRIGQVLINLLTNAVKYAPNSKIIKIKSVVENDLATVSVEDAGIGINKVDQARIFERFYRAEGRNEKTYPGFGIGLFIASEIIQRHKGKMFVSSHPGEGSIFSFTIPLK